MTSALSSDWNKRRFVWKSHILKCQDLPRGAKQLGVVLCDTYANRDTGQCWPSNETLAICLAVGVRSIQRYMAALFANNWVKKVPLRNKRRGLQLTFPEIIKHDIEHDRNGHYGKKNLSRKRDRSVTSYYKKKPSKNQLQGRKARQDFAVILVSESEVIALAAWRSWVCSNTEFDFDLLLQQLAEGTAYCFPSRFPSEHDDKNAEYHAFFQAMVAKAKNGIGE